MRKSLLIFIALLILADHAISVQAEMASQSASAPPKKGQTAVANKGGKAGSKAASTKGKKANPKAKNTKGKSGAKGKAKSKGKAAKKRAGKTVKKVVPKGPPKKTDAQLKKELMARNKRLSDEAAARIIAINKKMEAKRMAEVKKNEKKILKLMSEGKSLQHHTTELKTKISTLKSQLGVVHTQLHKLSGNEFRKTIGTHLGKMLDKIKYRGNLRIKIRRKIDKHKFDLNGNMIHKVLNQKIERDKINRLMKNKLQFEPLHLVNLQSDLKKDSPLKYMKFDPKGKEVGHFPKRLPPKEHVAKARPVRKQITEPPLKFADSGPQSKIAPVNKNIKKHASKSAAKPKASKPAAKPKASKVAPKLRSKTNKKNKKSKAKVAAKIKGQKKQKSKSVKKGAKKPKKVKGKSKVSKTSKLKKHSKPVGKKILKVKKVTGKAPPKKEGITNKKKVSKSKNVKQKGSKTIGGKKVVNKPKVASKQTKKTQKTDKMKKTGEKGIKGKMVMHK